MKNTIISVLFVFLSLSAFAEKKVDLFLAPNHSQPPVDQIKQNNLDIHQASMLKEQADPARTWYSIDHTSTLVGYVSKHDAGNHAQPRIYREKNTKSTLIAEADLNNPPVVLDATDPNWIEVCITTPKTLYFSQKNSGFSKVRTAAMPESSTYFEGTLRERPSFLGLRSKYKYELLGAHNKPIALLDTSKLVLSGPITQFYGKEVAIEGTAHPRSKSKSWIIQAHNMRAK